MYVPEMAPLLLEVQFEGLGITGLEWRHNGMELGQGLGIETMVNSGFTEARLALQEFQLNSHSGRYEVLVESPAGRAVLATWEVQLEGNEIVAGSTFSRLFTDVSDISRN